MNRKYGAFSSVDDPQKLSESVASFVKLLGLIVGGWAALKGSHVAIDNTIVEQTTDALVVVVTSGLAVWHSSNLLFGLMRKIIAAFSA